MPSPHPYSHSQEHSEQRSLFGEILDWMLTPLLLLWPLSLAITWAVAQSLANKPFDRALEYNVRTLAQQVRVDGEGRLLFSLPLPEHAVLRSDEADLMYYQVLGRSGQRLAGEVLFPAFPSASTAAATGRVLLRDDELHGIELRVAALWVELPWAAGGPVLVQVAETREKRSVLATEIIKGVMLPQFIILPLAVLLVWLALTRGIRPLQRLEQRIRVRKPEDLSALNTHLVPLEVLPLVTAVNDLLGRLRGSLATQKRFLADAAHQLKTPLAGLRMQAELALRQDFNTDDLKRSLQQVGRSSERATHTVNQLLALARAEGAGATLQRQPCNLVVLAVEVMQDVLPLAWSQQVDIGYEGADAQDPGVWVQGNPVLLKELVRNLLTNALHYCPQGGSASPAVTLRVLPEPIRLHQRPPTVVLQVEDNGSGIAAEDKAFIFEPFFRPLGNTVDGSGLGLPIVQEIARQHGADLQLLDAHPARQPKGTCAVLCLPTVPAVTRVA